MIILILIIGILIIKLNKTIKQRNIYYSNYKNCLIALKEYDSDLADYLNESEVE